jgi:hypothetical protein
LSQTTAFFPNKLFSSFYSVQAFETNSEWKLQAQAMFLLMSMGPELQDSSAPSAHVNSYLIAKALWKCYLPRTETAMVGRK